MAKVDASALSPEEIERIRELVLRAITPIKSPTSKSELGRVFWQSQRTRAGRDLPHYYLVYFLLVELLHFPHSGQYEKIAWSVPIEFEGAIYLIDHRKFGVGIFCESTPEKEAKAKRIVSLISKGVAVANPFFRHLAAEAVRQSKINVNNNSASLFKRYEYLRDRFRTALAEARVRKDEITTQSNSDSSIDYSFPSHALAQEARWIGIAAVDAFFSWTEHVFIHIAIIQNKLTTGEEVADFIGVDWKTKFKRALDITDKESKLFYDSLCSLRGQIRNYMAHGAFGKEGEAFDFHSAAGAVPVILEETRRAGRFSFVGERPFDEETAISTIEDFITHLWSGVRQPAWLYIQDACLPMILTFAKDGTYEDSMQSSEDMERFIHGLTRQMDNSANMDW